MDELPVLPELPESVPKKYVVGKVVGVYLSLDDHERLHELALERKITMSELGRTIIQDFLNAGGGE